MDDSRFDTWVRAWGTPSRRGVARLIAASGLGSLFSARGVEDAAAKCVGPGKKCKKKNGKKKKCCGGAKCKGKKCVCSNGGLGCGKKCCVPGQLCETIDNKPSCVNGQIPVNGECVPEQPGACASGVCGCGPGGCGCRNADCAPPGASCEGEGHKGCCDGLCFVGNPDFCDPNPDD